jgi:alginate O-acetyltransferase complex protein AlgI
MMWLLAGALFFAGKVASLRGARLSGWRRAAFVLGWVGMDTGPFREGREKGAGHPLSWYRPLLNIFIGIVLIWGGARWFTHPLAAGWVGMVGLIFLLHFGIFGVLARVWHAAGVPVAPIMHCPVASTSLTEFWGRRWNLAFRDLAHRFVFMPVSRYAGHAAALWASFAASGLAHELVISVPAGAGFGLPTSYFLMQALGITLERKADTPVRSHRNIADRSVPLTRWRWLRTHAFTVLPAFVLFHPPFVERVMVPFFHVIGALP